MNIFSGFLKWLKWIWLLQKINEFSTQYFLPGQVVLHIEHPSNVSRNKLAKALSDFLSGQATEQQEKQTSLPRSGKLDQQLRQPQKQQFRFYDEGTGSIDWKTLIVPPEKESILIFPLRNDEGFEISIVPAQIIPLPEPLTRIRRWLSRLIQSLLPKGLQLQWYPRLIRQRELFQLVKLINDELGNEGLLIADNITLRSAAPNWLISGAHHGGSTGGPGSWPVEAHAPLEDWWKPNIKNTQGLNALGSGTTQGKNVYVAILDTAPTELAMDTAYAEWRWQGHRLLEGLWSPSSNVKSRSLQLHPALDSDTHKLHESLRYSVQKHRYWMRDHGLFVAGTIHAIAPHAKLHLYEVLNPFGIGTIETIGQGLLKVLGNKNFRPVIINCSFMLDLPDHSALDENLERMTISIRQIFERLGTQERVIVVAAAGNENHILRSRPATLYPAAFRNVFGVGALKNGRPEFNGIYTPAAYSNWADDQNPDEGYMTLGGEGGSEQGILGVYTNDFPTLSFFWQMWDYLFGWVLGGSTHAHVKYRRNTTGWAWWTGTSFAAAILSGILAALPSQPGNSRALRNFREAQQALDRITQQTPPGQIEKVISTEQLPP